MYLVTEKELKAEIEAKDKQIKALREFVGEISSYDGSGIKELKNEAYDLLAALDNKDGE